MSQMATMVFGACRSEGPACIQYSWVPTGRRRSITLRHNEPAGTSTDPAEQATHVQVYKLLNVRMCLPPDGWQFPAGPPKPGVYLVGACVHVTADRAIGYGIYQDGSVSAASYVDLVPMLPPYDCNEPDGDGR